MSAADPSSTRGDRGSDVDPEEPAARQRNADVAAAGIESSFLTFRMLPQMVLPIGGIPLFSFFIFAADDPAVTVRCLAGIALMAASVWLHVRAFKARQEAARAVMRGETYDRSGFSHPYLAWFLGLAGFAGPWYFT